MSQPRQMIGARVEAPNLLDMMTSQQQPQTNIKEEIAGEINTIIETRNSIMNRYMLTSHSQSKGEQANDEAVDLA